jgi:hypothetical protein
MQVRLRHADDSDSIPFTEIHFSELPDLITFINKSGGVHITQNGDTYPYMDYQIVVDGAEAYVDIYVGE